jgi:hypothetical protein
MLLANLLQGVRIGRRGLLVGAAVTVAAVASNLVVLRDGKNAFLLTSVLTRADLAAIEIAHRTVDPTFQLTPEVAGTPTLIDVQADKYLLAVREYGSPAYTPAQLTGASESGRRQADIVLSKALPLSLATRRGAYGPDSAAENCIAFPAGRHPPTSEVRLSPGLTRIELAPGPGAGFSLRRFAVSEFPVVTRGAPGESVTLLRIPPDASRRPWYLHVDATQRARVCR